MRRSFLAVLSFAGIVLTGALAGTAAAAPPQEKVININGFNLHYVEEGQGEPVVFVHGSIADLRAWNRQREAVGKSYQFIAYTRRYYGDEPWLDKGQHFSDTVWAGDLVAFIKALGRGPVHAVTWSGGGGTVMRAAVEHPELFRSLTFYEWGAGGEAFASRVSGDPELAAARKQISEAFAAGQAAVAAGDTVTGARLLIETVFSMRPGTMSALGLDFGASVADNTRTLTLTATAPLFALTCEVLAGLHVPTLAMSGDKTTLTVFAYSADRMSACLPNATRVILPGAAHGAPVQNSDAFNAALLDFLASVKRKQPQASK